MRQQLTLSSVSTFKINTFAAIALWEPDRNAINQPKLMGLASEILII